MLLGRCMNNNAAAILLPDNESLIETQPLYRCSPGSPILSLLNMMHGGTQYRWPATNGDLYWNSSQPNSYNGTLPGLVPGSLLAVPPSLASEDWLYIRPLLPSEGMQVFSQQVSDYTKSGFNISLSADSVDLTNSVALHDAIMLYAYAATKVLSEEGDLSSNSRLVMQAVRSTSFEGVGGKVALGEHGDRIVSYEVMNYVAGVDSSEHKGMTFKPSTTGFQLQEYEGGYRFCSRYSDVTPTIESSVDACKGRCSGQRGCWALTYYAEASTEFDRRCYVYMSAAECGTLDGYLMGSLWLVPVGIFNSSTRQYTANSRAVMWPGNTTDVPIDYSPGGAKLSDAA